MPTGSCGKCVSNRLACHNTEDGKAARLPKISFSDDSVTNAQDAERVGKFSRPLMACAVKRRRFSSGCKFHPATGIN